MTDIREEMKDYVGADLLFAQMDEIRALREENTQQAARIAALEADKAKLIAALFLVISPLELMEADKMGTPTRVLAGEALTEARAVLAEVTK